MPMETSAVGVRPVNRPAAPGGVDGVGRRGGESASAGFRPQTNVSIETAIEDMAGILSKISTAEAETVEKMPADLQKVIENVMKQAFSFDETLGEGLGSTMESQRFSMEQLTSVARTLLQMSALAEKGYDVNISDGLQKLLTTLKAAVTQEPGGQALEPVLLLKAAFGLINGKEAANLPQALQQLIASMQQGGGQAFAQQPSESMAFLQKLVQYFMPRSGAAMAQQPAAQGQPAQAGTQQMAQGTIAQGFMGGAANTEGAGGQAFVQGGTGAQPQAQAVAQGLMTNQNAVQGQAAETMTQGPAPAQGQAAASAQMPAQGQATVQGETNAQGQPTAQGQASVPGQAGNAAQNAQNTAAQTQGQPQGSSNANTANGPTGANGTNGSNANTSTGQTVPNSAQAATEGDVASQAKQAGMEAGRANAPAEQQAAQTERQAPAMMQDAMQNMTMTAREAKEVLMSQPLQNTQEAMQTMKQLARFFLEQGNVSQADAQTLQAFADSGSTTFSAKEARQLETLLRVVQQNIPATVQQAAVQQNIPELPRLWAFMQLADLSVAKRLNARQLKKAAKDVAEFVFSMRGSMEGEHAVKQGQRSMNFMMPMYLGENEKSYPAYIHVYDETQEDRETGLPKKETWLRLCVLTENLGAVELTCRVYEQQHLDMRLVFAHREVAQEFRSFVPDLRKSMRGSRLKLEDVAIAAPGE